jgi:hypothetical protein
VSLAEIVDELSSLSVIAHRLELVTGKSHYDEECGFVRTSEID